MCHFLCQAHHQVNRTVRYEKHPSLYIRKRALFLKQYHATSLVPLPCWLNFLLCCVFCSVVAQHSKVVIIATARIKFGEWDHTPPGTNLFPVSKMFKCPVFCHQKMRVGLVHHEFSVSLSWTAANGIKAGLLLKQENWKIRLLPGNIRWAFSSPESIAFIASFILVLIIIFAWRSFTCHLTCSYNMWTFFMGAVAGKTW